MSTYHETSHYPIIIVNHAIDLHLSCGWFLHIIIIIIIIIILYLTSDFRVAYAANISEHLPTQP